MIGVGELSNKLVGGEEEMVVFVANESWHENKTTSSIERVFLETHQSSFTLEVEPILDSTLKMHEAAKYNLTCV